MKKTAATFFACVMLFIFSGAAHALCVSVPDANLRSGPGTDYEKTWEVFRYMPLKKLSLSGNWYKVEDVDGDVHWIYKKLVTEQIRCAVVKADKINVRTGPGTNYSKNALSPALKYDSFKVLTIKSLWVEVVDEFGDRGWIYRNLLWIP